MAGAFVCSATAAQAADGLQLRAEAGLGGTGRPGRWVPVRITIDNRGEDVSGDLLVEWGDFRLHRDVEIASPSRADIEVYVRTPDVRGSIRVSLTARGTLIAVVDAPINMVPDDALFSVCIGDATGPSSSGCTVTIPPGASPASIRGYDSADDVVWNAGPESVVTPEQREALREWRAYHALEQQGLLGLAPRAVPGTRPHTGTKLPLLLASAGGMGTLLLAGCFWIRSGGPALRSYGAVVGAVTLGAVASVVAGHRGPGAEVQVTHASTVQQIGNRAVAVMRSTIEYPAFARYALTVISTDGGLTPRGVNSTEQWTDSEGRPVRRGTFGRGYREELEIESWAIPAPFEVQTVGDRVRVSNVSNTEMTECRFPDGYVPSAAGTMSPGETVEAHTPASVYAPFFACASGVSPITVVDATFPVRHQGHGIVSVLIPSQPPAVEAGP